jgi:hypothetical protein
VYKPIDQASTWEGNMQMVSKFHNTETGALVDELGTVKV